MLLLLHQVSLIEKSRLRLRLYFSLIALLMVHMKGIIAKQQQALLSTSGFNINGEVCGCRRLDMKRYLRVRDIWDLLPSVYALEH